MYYTFKNLQEVVLIIANCDNPPPILLRAKHGVGKSSWAQSLSYVLSSVAGINYKFITRRASQMTEGDQLGLPFKDRDRGTTKYCPPDWFYTACQEPTILLIDEIDRATHEVSQGFFELGDSRCLAGFELHPRTVIISCINGGEDQNNYSVNAMDPAFLDRWVTFDLEPSLDDWVEWGRERGGIHPEILSFIIQFPEFLEVSSSTQMKSGKVYPSRRSWDRLNSVLCKNSNLMTDAIKAGSGDLLTKITLIANGFVGEEAAVGLRGWIVETRNKIVTPKDILLGDKTSFKKIERFNVSEWNNFVERCRDDNLKAFLSEEFLKKNSDNRDRLIKNIGNMISHMPSEVFLKFWQEVVHLNWGRIEVIGFDLVHAIHNQEIVIDGKKEPVYQVLQRSILGRESSAIK